MRDDEIDEALELPPEDPLTAMLEGLDSLEGFGAPDETPAPALGRRELDAMVDQVLDEELKRLSARKG